MMLLSYFGEPANYPFLVALLVVFILAAIEGVGAMIGAGVFGFLDGLLPDIDLGAELDIEFDAPDLQSPSITGEFLSWLRIGQVPVIFSLIVFLTAFGLIGLTLQGLCLSLLGTALSALWVALPTLFLSIPVVGFGNRFLAFVLPRDETSAISRDRLVGKVATITLGEARVNFPAQAKVKDRFGQTHYIMLAPDNESETYGQGDRLLLVRRSENIYFGIRPSSKALQ
ncbi:YqiJ family protein [uncultured Cohaesibacter sp.]|uniref:YqiJ family protein n=1 Tax=uncultured Cohaesibacter sp. TaxID=1002546 RepID=UPI0029C700A6|nr:YqiJ family protein [uncultured Cohaesibacter sp.]